MLIPPQSMPIPWALFPVEARIVVVGRVVGGEVVGVVRREIIIAERGAGLVVVIHPHLLRTLRRMLIIPADEGRTRVLRGLDRDVGASTSTSTSTSVPAVPARVSPALSLITPLAFAPPLGREYHELESASRSSSAARD
ncbi:hypothetical protein B0H16DRAFT_1898454 [Mycena metata]|uniref:Uncharacterized protein n=1 Tax=Mycena metata TaxID=1033252 RepID=A0AAD7HBN5_9AGAR|nr:hypothetical protein B0H16DRAFT_1898454 [Mycena metata]